MFHFVMTAEGEKDGQSAASRNKPDEGVTDDDGASGECA
jgi:hypothetical protein